MEPLTPPEPATFTAPASAPTTGSTFSGLRRSLVTGALALGLLMVGGSAVVLAASPEPSASSAPSTTTDPSTDDTSGATDTTKPDCPEGGRGSGDGGAATDDGGSTDDGDTETPSSAPSSQAPTATPAT